ncbi:MAG: hypothetical protein ACI4E1_09190 [Lachnospira sp.]
MEISKDQSNLNILLKLGIVFLISRIVLLICVPVHTLFFGTAHGTDIVSVTNVWDAAHYKYIIENGYTFPTDYDPQANWAFFPLYSLIGMFLRFITGGYIPTYVLGMIISNVCIFLASFFAVKTVEATALDKSKCNVWLMGTVIFMTPYAFYCNSTYTEGLFIACIAAFFYFAVKRKFVIAGVCAALASATRIVGCTLVFALVTEMYFVYCEDKNKEVKAFFKNFTGVISEIFKRPVWLFSVLLCPLGIFAYMAFLYGFCGDAFAFLHVQIAWRENNMFPVFEVLFRACFGLKELRYVFWGWFCIAAFVLYGYMIKKNRVSMGIFGIISLLVPLCSDVMSTPRFIIGTYVAYIGLYDLLSGRSRVVRWTVMGILMALEIYMTLFWYNKHHWLL